MHDKLLVEFKTELSEFRTWNLLRIGEIIELSVVWFQSELPLGLHLMKRVLLS